MLRLASDDVSCDRVLAPLPISVHGLDPIQRPIAHVLRLQLDAWRSINTHDPSGH